MKGSLATFNDMDYSWTEIPCFLICLKEAILLNCNLLEQGTNVETSPRLPISQVFSITDFTEFTTDSLSKIGIKLLFVTKLSSFRRFVFCVLLSFFPNWSIS